MSNMLAANGVLYFQMPKFLFSGRYKKSLSGSALALFLYIHYRVQEQSKVSIFMSAGDLRRHLGMAGDTVLTARAKLEDAGLIRYERKPTGYVYTLVNPETGKVLLNHSKGDAPPFDLNDLSPDELEAYFYHHTSGQKSRTGNRLTLCCPLHEDSKPSLSVDLDKGGLWNCHSCDRGGKLIDFEQGVAKEQITSSEALARIKGLMESLGIKSLSAGAQVAIYPYHSAEGKLLFEVIRYRPKKFLQRQPHPGDSKKYIWSLDGAKRVLYNLPAIQDADVVCLLEGEKDCDNFSRLGMTSNLLGMRRVAVSTCPGGAGKWDQSYSKTLKGKMVVIFPDNDITGRRHAKEVADSLKGVAAEVRLREFSETYKDMTDFLEAGGEKDLAEIIGKDWIFVPGLI